MIKKIPTLLFSLLLISFVANAKEKDNLPATLTKTSLYKKMIHTNPLSLTVGGFEMGFEKVTAQKESFYLQLGYYLSQNAGALDVKSSEYSNMNGIRLEMQYRFYRKTNNYIKNIFIAPFVNFKTLSADYEKWAYTFPNSTSSIVKEKHAATTVSFGYMMGIRKSVFENVYMDFSIGGGIFIPVAGDSHEQLNMPLVNPYQRGVQFKANLGFCLAL